MAGMVRGGGITWAVWLAAGVLTVATAVWVLVTRLTAAQLSTADQVASVVAAVVALLGVPIAVHGLVLARRVTAPAGRAAGGEVRQRVRAGGDAVVAGGDLTIGPGRRRRGPAAGGKIRQGSVRQDVRAGRDARVAGGDLHLAPGPDQR
jgi:hypothetical protein